MISLEVEDYSLKPKYLQIAEAIVAEIEEGKLTLNDRLPSVNQLSEMAQVSRETVFKALNHLSEKGIVQSANRKGYYVMKTDVIGHLRIFFLLDKFTIFKEEMFQAFQQTIGEHGEVDIYFHHHNLNLFRSLIKQNLAQYTHFALVTYFKEDIGDIIGMIPPHKLLILDSYERNIKGDSYMVYQDFSRDIMQSLDELGDRLKHYQRIIAIAPGSLYHAEPVLEGLKAFSEKTGFPTQILPSLNPRDFRKGDVYITLTSYDQELVQIIKLCREKDYTIGEDVGIISHNDTPVKEVLAGGITVISTDFTHMGKKAAELLLEKNAQVFANPTRLIRRSSL